MKPHLLLLLPILGLVASADTIRLRDGTEYAGTVLKEEDDAYVVLVQVTASIRDERRIPKSDVLEIVQVKKDQVAFGKLAELVPTPDLLTHDDYRERISMLEGFTSEFSDSKHIRKAQEMLKALDAERKVIADGGIKWQGQLIEGPERKAQAYTLDAAIAASKVKELGDAGDLLGALRAWDALETNFLGSSAYRETIPYALRLMRSQLQAVSRLVDSFDARMKARQDGLAAMPPNDRPRSERAIADEAAAYQKRLDAEKEAKEKWFTLSPWHKETLQATKSRLEQEIRRLDSLDPATLPDTDAAWNEAWKVLSGSPSPSEASSAISAARTARLSQPYLDILQAKAPQP